jgi:diguanylate cyclase (GGDEF)-like protein
VSLSTRSRQFINKRRAQASRENGPVLTQYIQKLALRLQQARSRLRETSQFKQKFSSVVPAVKSTGRKLWRNVPDKSLINEILILQLFFAFVVGGLAIVGLWLTSTWAIEDNLKKWGERWISELDDLAAPLYSEADAETFVRIENYIDSFPEISFVRFYAPDGRIIFSDFRVPETADIAELNQAALNGLASDHGSEELSMMESADNDLALIRISKPVWAESFSEDGFLGRDLNDEQNTEVELLGFVELGLNFTAYASQLTRNILFSSLLFFSILVLLTAATGILIRRALKPLAKLQDPLRELAEGKTDFSIETSGHREIMAITDALNKTVSSLNERDKKLWQLANHDNLTGLVNRHKFSEILVDEIAAIKKHKTESALLFVDLDQFKYVNDTLGHAAGDRLLKRAAEILKNGIRKNDVVSRFGGDEFTILLSDINESEARTICDSLMQDMQEHHFHEDGKAFSIRCSIGIAIIDSGDLSPAEVLARADMACHDAKSRGRNRFELYRASGAEMEQMTADMGWSQHIQKALKEDLFVIQYQPIVCTANGKPTHYEVLLRMRADSGQLIPPAAFLPAASRFGMMTEVDQWVIRNAIRELATHRGTDEDLTLTLNISGNIFEDSDLYGCIEENLIKNNLPAESLVLEITEQVAVRNISTAADQIAQLSKLGCRFAIDDFGAGYSSYTYLKSLPVHYIKIDGSFIKTLKDDLVDQMIVHSISQIAKATNKMTIAEHVPDIETFQLLGELGIDYAQGYFIGEPKDHPTCEPVAVPLAAARKKKAKTKAKAKSKRKTVKLVS